MKKNTIHFLSLFFLLFLFSFGDVRAENVSFLRNLKLGDSGSDILLLQKLLNNDPETAVSLSGLGSSGQETEYFGAKTKLAVIRFQEKYHQEVLFPANLSSGTGFVGNLTRTKLNSLLNTKVSTIQPAPSTQTSQSTELQKVHIDQVFPTRVKVGETVTLKGQGFTATGNDIIVRFGILEQKITNVPSFDGTTLMFAYNPPGPEVDLNLTTISPSVLPILEDTLKQNAISLETLSHPYKGIKNEAEFELSLQKQGKKLSDLDDSYTVIVQNTNGMGASQFGILKGARKFTFETDNLTSKQGSFLTKFKDVIVSFFDFSSKVAWAQVPGGGFTTFLTFCTCSPGYLTTVVGVPGTPSGMYYFGPATRYWVGTGIGSANYLSLYTPGAGLCSMYAGVTCIPLPSHLMNFYGGSL